MVKRARIVRPYRPEDTAALVQIHNKSYPGNQLRLRPNSFSRYLDDILSVGGKVWTVSDSNNPVGYANVAPVPGLEAVLDLQGCIDPNKRRQGFGSYLLDQLIQALKENGRFQLSHAVYSLNSPAALFLQSHHFTIEHIEVQLLLETPAQLSPVSFPTGFHLATYSMATAVKKFRQAYDVVFQGAPWYQPYTSDREITADLDQPADLLFLQEGTETAGFAWLRMPEPELGEIEPFGLLPAYQGKGFGSKFLTAAIHQLVKRGAKRVRIGAWQRNEKAIRLYRQIGFKQINTQTYLAYDIG